jgi:hypothetical protein
MNYLKSIFAQITFQPPCIDPVLPRSDRPVNPFELHHSNLILCIEFLCHGISGQYGGFDAVFPGHSALDANPDVDPSKLGRSDNMKDFHPWSPDWILIITLAREAIFL